MQNDREPLHPVEKVENDIALQVANHYGFTRTLNQYYVPVGPDNTLTTCPFCNATVKTNIRYTSTTRTHSTALKFCILIPFCGCCFPHCMTSTRNVDHYCPNCTKYLGTYQK